jgi:hypothetical protein
MPTLILVAFTYPGFSRTVQDYEELAKNVSVLVMDTGLVLFCG